MRKGVERKALRQRKNLAFSIGTCLEKERLRSKVIARKVEIREKLKKMRWGWMLA